MFKRFAALPPFRILALFTLLPLLFAAKCNRGYREIEAFKEKRAADAIKMKVLLQTLAGTPYTEVHRTFDNGLSFSPVGFQLVPEWRITFLSPDSIRIFSPKKNRFLNAPVVFDHDSILNVAWAWLKLRYVKKDSMQFMVLHVSNRIIDNEKEHVYMTFYTNNYIQNVLHTDTNQLRRPTRRDTGYIQAKALVADRIPDSSFAGTTPAVLKSKVPFVSVHKEVTPFDDVNGGQVYDDYLSPTYDITIHHAYQQFGYSFTAFVDEKGVITFRKSIDDLSGDREYAKYIIDAMKGIVNGYLKLYLDVTPGKTLGIPHRSIIFLNVGGLKD